MSLLSASGLLFLLLNLVHKLLNLCPEAVLELTLHLSVLLNLGGSCCQSELQLFPSFFTLLHESLILSNVFL